MKQTEPEKEFPKEEMVHCRADRCLAHIQVCWPVDSEVLIRMRQADMRFIFASGNHVDVSERRVMETDLWEDGIVGDVF